MRKSYLKDTKNYYEDNLLVVLRQLLLLKMPTFCNGHYNLEYMAIDHSLTYKKKSLRNLPHNLRLKNILGILKKNKVQDYGKAYLDVGCSNGYITNLISKSFDFERIKGVDHNNENIENAKNLYENIEFDYIDLNKLNTLNGDKFNLVTCFETLEHVENLDNAILSILPFA